MDEIAVFNRKAKISLSRDSIKYTGVFENVDEEFYVIQGGLKDKITINSLHPDIPTNAGAEGELVIAGTLELSREAYLYVGGMPVPDKYETSRAIELRDEVGEVLLVIKPLIVRDSAEPSKLCTCFLQNQQEGALN